MGQWRMTYRRTPQFADSPFEDPAYSRLIKCDLLLHSRPCDSCIWGFKKLFILFCVLHFAVFRGIFDFPLWITNCREPIPFFTIETMPRHSWIWHSWHFPGIYPANRGVWQYIWRHFSGNMFRSEVCHFCKSYVLDEIYLGELSNMKIYCTSKW